VVGSDVKAIECEICKGWFHIGCVDITENEFEVLAEHTLGTIHWYCATCNVKSLELLRLVFGLQDRLLKTEREMDNMKRDTNSKLSKIESEYEAVRDDIKALSQKIDDGIKHCMMDSEKLVKSMHNETKNQIEDVIKGMDNKVSTDELKTALNQHTEETYSSKIKNEVDQHLNGMDSMILRVNTKIDEVRKKTIVEQDRENRACNIVLYNVCEPQASNLDERGKEDREFCLELFNKVLRVPINEEDMKKFVRMGKVELVQAEKARPILIQFRDRILKNMIMESLGKLKGADEKYKKVIFTHDMTVEDREDYKKLVAEAKKKENDNLSGEYIYRVKGAPGSFRVLEIRKRY